MSTVGGNQRTLHFQPLCHGGYPFNLKIGNGPIGDSAGFQNLDVLMIKFTYLSWGEPCFSDERLPGTFFIVTQCSIL